MKTNNIVIDRNLFITLSPKTFNNNMFKSGDQIKIIAVNSEKLMPWGNASVPSLEIEANGNPMEIPINIILGTVINNPEVIYNKGKGDLECVDFVGNTLCDYLKSNAKELEDTITFPDQITIIKRINKGIPKDQVHQKKDIYDESFLVQEGNTFDSQFRNLEFIPTIFKSATGVFRTNGTYLVAID